MAPQVSIVILNYNTNTYTCNCIKSIKEKTIGVSYEIIVVDNASPKEDPNQIKQLFPEINLILSPENLGFSKGNNLGIEHAKADVYLLLNSDTTLVNDAVSIAYKRLMSHPRIGVAGCRLIYEDGRLQRSTGRLWPIKEQIIHLLRIPKLLPKKIRSKYMLGNYFDHAEEVSVGWIWGTFFMIKKEVIQKMPGKKLADDFFMYCEDFQWGIETKRAGYKILFTPDAQVIHYAEGDKSSSSYKMKQDNTEPLLLKYYGKFYLAIYRFLKKI
jgi:GT2 family glycosyltransferase